MKSPNHSFPPFKFKQTVKNCSTVLVQDTVTPITFGLTNSLCSSTRRYRIYVPYLYTLVTINMSRNSLMFYLCLFATSPCFFSNFFNLISKMDPTFNYSIFISIWYTYLFLESGPVCLALQYESNFMAW